MRLCIPLAAVLLMNSAAEATPRSIPLAPPSSEVAFRAYGMGLLPLDASFRHFAGRLTYDPDDKSFCRVELQVEVVSLAADDTSIRDRIIGPDFMQADRFPTLTYTGRCETPEELGGMLAMHGVTRPFALAVEWKRGEVVAEGRLRRADWGMTAMPLLGGRTVRIRVTVPLDPGP